MNRNLCKPCAEKLRRKGKIVTFKFGGRDNKITCDACGCRRFGATYDVRGKEKRRPKWAIPS